MALTWRNQHDPLPEEFFALETIADVQRLQRELIEVADVSPTVARSIPAWMLERLQGLPDATSSATRARYRKALAKVLTHRPDGPGRLSGPRSAERGAAHLSLVAGAGVAAGALLAGTPTALAALTPIIVVPDVTSSDPLPEVEGAGLRWAA